MITANEETQSIFWPFFWKENGEFRSIFDWVLNRYLKIQSHDSTVQINTLDNFVRVVVMLIHNCVCNNQERM